MYPATPYDAKGLLTAALAGDDPVIFFESQKLYDVGEWFQADGVPASSYEVEIGAPDVKRPGPRPDDPGRRACAVSGTRSL